MAEQKDVVLTKSKDILESYIFSTSKRDFTVYSERLLLKIVEVAQQQLAGACFKDGTSLGQVEINRLGEAVLEIPIRSLLGSEDSSNYSQAKKAVMELMSSPYFVERPKVRGGRPVLDSDGNQQFEMVGNQILNHCEVNVKPGVAILHVNPETWRAILDFSKGFRKYDLNAALKLRKPAALRLFRLLSNQSNPITYTIEQLRQMCSLEGKYPNSADFIKRIIVPAQEELDKNAPWSFDFVRNYAESSEQNMGRTGRKAVTSITFIPKRKILNYSIQATYKLTSLTSVVSKELQDLLINKFGFTLQGIKNNSILFDAARKCGMDTLGFLDKIAPSALRAVNPQGYVIKAICRHLEEKYGVEISDSQIVL